MSGPIQSLKKTKRVPLVPSNQKEGNLYSLPKQEDNEEQITKKRIAPFRNTQVQRTDEELYAQEMNKKFSDYLQKEIVNDIQHDRSSRKSPRGDSEADADLMSVMLKRLTTTEKQLALANQDGAEKDKRIRHLEFQVKQLKLKNARNDDEESYRELKAKCVTLQRQVHEMERFLNDYGLVWIGDDESEDDEDSSTQDNSEKQNTASTTMWQPEQSLATATAIDFNLVIENIKELNLLANADNPKIVKTTGRAVFQIPDAIPISIYSNGFALYEGPFRYYDEPYAQQFIRDICDGYFPSELQSRHPDGVPFQIYDHRETEYRNQRLDNFPGLGNILGGKSNPPGNMVSRRNKVKVTSKLAGKPVTVDKFLSKLPESVIRDGKIVNIRSDIKENIQTSDSTKSKVVIVETKQVKDMKVKHADESERPATPHDITTLRIKNEDNSQVYIVKLKFNDTIQDLYKYISNQRSSSEPPFEIRSSFPKKLYTDMDATLYESGLTPNATLFLTANKLK
ncbi:UBX domain-containing protein 11 [Trichoplax sp. H2]|nr:UBX domain-containing protein 11 [Trichoplax sp. H2]|eukprot:RDD38344.1 UBX domain-containing protein 11 [Trichoplax sp. H2]